MKYSTALLDDGLHICFRKPGVPEEILIDEYVIPNDLLSAQNRDYFEKQEIEEFVSNVKYRTSELSRLVSGRGTVDVLSLEDGHVYVPKALIADSQPYRINAYDFFNGVKHYANESLEEIYAWTDMLITFADDMSFPRDVDMDEDSDDAIGEDDEELLQEMKELLKAGPGALNSFDLDYNVSDFEDENLEENTLAEAFPVIERIHQKIADNMSKTEIATDFDELYDIMECYENLSELYELCDFVERKFENRRKIAWNKPFNWNNPTE